MFATGSAPMDAEREFARQARARRRAALMGWIARRPAECGRLAVYDEPGVAAPRLSQRRGLREIPLDAICGTFEPSKATLFDHQFRPAPRARLRWQRLWLAEQRGIALPPISVVAVGEIYAIVDGHHRVSVARARGAS